MKRLFWWTSSISILLIALILSARLIGSRNKVPGAAIFDPGNCSQPCWHGIQPGKTTLDEAEAILRADPLFSDIRREQPVVRFHLDWTINSNPVYYGGVHAQNNVITKIFILSFVTYKGIPLSEAMIALGSPQFAMGCKGSSVAKMQFADKVTLTIVTDQVISFPSMPSASVEWTGPYVIDAYYTTNEDREIPIMPRWQGFGARLEFGRSC